MTSASLPLAYGVRGRELGGKAEALDRLAS
jgi:hypothetical protein